MKKEEAIEEFQQMATERQGQLEWCHRVHHLASQRMCGVIPVDATRSLRSLYSQEIATLQECQCCCQDWSQIRLLLNSEQHRLDQSSILRSLVSKTTFGGSVVLIVPSQEESSTHRNNNGYQQLPVGIHSNTYIGNSILSLHARVYHATLLQDTFVDDQATVVNCGKVTTTTTDYHQLLLSVGPEGGGGRDLTVTPESTMVDVCHQLMNKLDAQSSPPTGPSNFNVISRHALIRDTATIESVYLHSYASIEAASSVSRTVLFSNATIGSACTVTKALLQWNAAITDQSSVTETLLMEQAHAGPHSLVASSILGPDVHVSAGEVHASVIGPNTNAHHQSLLIGVLWPLGRGNVGYGANVGSNHTGRLPDQETVAGEGTFWGLSCVVKMPVDLSAAPYSLVAAGTTVPPQRVCMPFSLLVTTEDGNQIIPGWVLQNSPYTLTRSEKKYATRRKAVRHKYYTGWKIIRPEVMDQCKWARRMLMEVEPKASYRTDKAIPGIGSNTLTEKGRQSGIWAYTECIQRFALQGLLSFLLDAKRTGRRVDDAFLTRELLSKRPERKSYAQAAVSWGTMPWDVDERETWLYQHSVLLEEFPCETNVGFWTKECLHKLVTLEKDYADRLYKCKKRDDTRGAKTIPGYIDAHVVAEDDPVVKEVRAAVQQTEEDVLVILRDLDQAPFSRL